MRSARASLLLRVAAALVLAASGGRADEAAARKIPTSDHVTMSVAGKQLSGWPIDPDSKEGAIVLSDEGAFVVVERGPAVRVVETTARPVTEMPGTALVDGLAHVNEVVRDRCQELLAQRGPEAQPLLALALAAKDAEARRRGLVLLAAAPMAPLASAVRKCVDDRDQGVRAAALCAYVALKRPDALRVCVERLEGDDSPRVLHSAIENLGELRDMHAVEPLLEHLANCSDRDLQIVTFAALRKITGKTLGRDENAWRAWWTNHKDEVLPKDD